MKIPFLFPFVSAICVLSAAEESKNPALQMRDAATHEELAKTLRQVSRHDPMGEMKSISDQDPSVTNRPEGILSQSDFIAFNGTATLVPKRAILHVPSELKGRLVLPPGTPIRTWADFFAVNRAWITTVEVSRVQAEGNEPLAPDLLERIGKSRSLVVATYRGGPISVLPLKVETAAVPTNPNSATQP